MLCVLKVILRVASPGESDYLNAAQFSKHKLDTPLFSVLRLLSSHHKLYFDLRHSCVA